LTQSPAAAPLATNSPSPTLEPTPDLTPVPGSPSIEPTPVPGDILEFQLPTPVCPSPAAAPAAPAVHVAVGGGDPILAMAGSSTLQTCSTASTSDAAADDPKVGVNAHPGDKLTLSVPDGWSILAYEGFDRAANEDGVNVTPLVILPAPSASVQLSVPARKGRSIVGVTLAIVSGSGQVVGRVEERFQVKVA
jgi:hypothetical protein